MAQFDPANDPHLERERKKYDNPVVSREYILSCLTELKEPISLVDMCAAFGYQAEKDIERLKYRLKAMERDAQLLRDRKNRYALIEQLNLKRGLIHAHRDGYGFVSFGDQSEDWYVTPKQMRKVFHGDAVLVRPDGRSFRGRTEAFIVRTLNDLDLQLVGRFHHEGNTTFVIPLDPRYSEYIHIDEQQNKLKPGEGQVVVVEVLQRPTERFLATGIVKEILGDHLDPGLEIDIAIRNHQIPHEWPEQVLDEAGALEESVNPADISGRIDLRDMPLVTIDGADAKDFDDAVYCEKSENGGWVLWVAIADVSHYVKDKMALDAEAFNRGNSVYFPGQVVPMLPEVLSNGLCSLNPDVERLCMVCEMEVSQDGELGDSSFYPAVMRSSARLIYDDVGKLFDGEVSIRQTLGDLVDPLLRLHDLYKALKNKRQDRGAISFDTTESYIEFDEHRKIESIKPLIRNDAHKVIEECMILANVASAQFFNKHKIDGMYRIHEGPSLSAQESLREFLATVGIWLGGDDKPEPKDYQSIIQQIYMHPNAVQIQTMMLRSLSQAKYSPDNCGHFGLALPLYTHFTSPIRRYPDLIVHRLIKAHLAKTGSDLTGIETGQHYTNHALLEAGEHCSLTERRADDATREVVAWLKCEYMLEHIGKQYEGKVSSVAAFGVFVALEEVDVEGLVHVTDLPGDYYHFDPISLTMTGEKTGEIYQIGDKMIIEVKQVSLDDRKIDFSCIKHEMQGRKDAIVSARPGRKSKESRRSRKKTGKTSKAVARKRKPSKGRKKRK